MHKVITAVFWHRLNMHQVVTVAFCKNRKITSLVELFFPDGEKRQFESGVQLCSAVFENRYEVKEMKAVDATVKIYLQYVEQETDWIKEQTEKTGVEPNLFGGV